MLDLVEIDCCDNREDTGDDDKQEKSKSSVQNDTGGDKPGSEKLILQIQENIFVQSGGTGNRKHIYGK